jgi:hypothetical protein
MKNEINRLGYPYSASKIQDYLDCPRRFELRHILDQSCPAIPCQPVLEAELNIQRGNEFHFLAHQYVSKVPEEILRAQLQAKWKMEWFENFLSFFKSLGIKSALSEFSLTVNMNSFKLTAVYDLIYTTMNDRIGIIDWKTTSHIPKKQKLASRVQSILYPYVLFEGLPEFLRGQKFSPEDISMQYWYPSNPIVEIILPYGQDSHNKNHEFLISTIYEIERKNIGEFNLTSDVKKCGFCPYRSLCDRGVFANNIFQAAENDIEDVEMFPDLLTIPEIEFDI